MSKCIRILNVNLLHVEMNSYFRRKPITCRNVFVCSTQTYYMSKCIRIFNVNLLHVEIYSYFQRKPITCRNVFVFLT